VQTLNPGLKFRGQRISVKQRGDKNTKEVGW
jgi:hypothetical protein